MPARPRPRARQLATFATLVLLLALALTGAWWLTSGDADVASTPRALTAGAASSSPAVTLPAAAPAREPARYEVDTGGPRDATPPAATAVADAVPTARLAGEVLRASTGEPWPQRFRLQWSMGRQDPAALAALAEFESDDAHRATDDRGRFDLSDVPTWITRLTVKHAATGRTLGEVDLPSARDDLLDVVVSADGGWGLRGTVQDESGRVLIGASLAVRGRWLQTKQDGDQFLLLDLPYEFPGGRMTLVAQFAGRVSEELEVQVPKGPRIVELGPVVLASAGALVGRVLDPQGRPVKGCATVKVVEVLGRSPGVPPVALSRLTTESRLPGGDYRLDGVPPGLYVLSASATGTQGQSFSAPVSVFAGVDSVVDFVIGPGAELRGRVLLASGIPARDHVMRLVAVDRDARIEAQAITDNGGYFRFRDVTPGAKRLEGGGARAADGSEVLHLDVRPDEQLDGLDFTIDMGARLAGTVTDGSGTPVGGARVAVVPIGAPLKALVAEQVTGPDGRYAFEGLAPRTVSLRVMHDQYEYWARAVQPGEVAQRVTLGSMPVIWGLVADGSQQPVTDFRVSVPGAREQRSQTISDERGFFRVRTLRSGAHEVTVEAEGFATRTVTLKSNSGTGFFPNVLVLSRH